MMSMYNNEMYTLMPHPTTLNVNYLIPRQLWNWIETRIVLSVHNNPRETKSDKLHISPFMKQMPIFVPLQTAAGQLFHLVDLAILSFNFDLPAC